MLGSRTVVVAGAVVVGAAPDALAAGFGRIWNNILRNRYTGESRSRERTNSTSTKIHGTDFTISTLSPQEGYDTGTARSMRIKKEATQ